MYNPNRSGLKVARQKRRLKRIDKKQKLQDTAIPDQKIEESTSTESKPDILYPPQTQTK
jgi:hypothetical protein